MDKSRRRNNSCKDSGTQWYTVGKNCGHGRIRTVVHSRQELLARQDQNRGTQWARIVGKKGSEQGYTVDKNCWQERFRTGVHSGQELLARYRIRRGVPGGQELWPRQDQNRGTQRARTVDTAGSEQGYTVDENCWQEIIRTGVHSGQELLARND